MRRGHLRRYKSADIDSGHNKQYQTQDDAGYGRTHRVITEELPFRIGAEVGKLQFIFDQYLVEAGKRLFYLRLSSSLPTPGLTRATGPRNPPVAFTAQTGIRVE